MIYIAPIQGVTDAAWRHYHHISYPGDNRYFTPFIRCEHGTLRHRDAKDFTSELNKGTGTEAQIIFRDMREADILVRELSALGAKEINLNMGCPFPLQTGKGRGAGFIANTNEAAKLPELFGKYPEVSFSVKMRLGYESPDEWRNIIGTLNSLPLRFIALHPRVARQQYGGELHHTEFDAFTEASKNPVIFNGEIRTPEDATIITERHPSICGLMTGRGILGRPSLAQEITEGKEIPSEERLARMMKFHKALLRHYEETLCGDTQILSKIKGFWEYSEDEIGRKAWKAIRKSTTMPKYKSAIAMILQNREVAS
ncbi:MAG: tRNA-dihydrouridine synthase family protein [Candidatus Amulumruptor caecigallinarius]|nr:tRNA-dihydrouridine synthase family protein [Candidatus Amulumruptor caecigallinarius]